MRSKCLDGFGKIITLKQRNNSSKRLLPPNVKMDKDSVNPDRTVPLSAV